MKQLNKLQTTLFALGGLMMVAGIGLYVFGILSKAVSIIFLTGSVLFAAIQIAQRYTGTNITIRRLRKIMVVADVAFVVAGLFMVEDAWLVLYHQLGLDNAQTFGIDTYTSYMQYVHNNWVVALLIAVILELYSMNRISYELKKENRNTEKTLKE